MSIRWSGRMVAVVLWMGLCVLPLGAQVGVETAPATPMRGLYPVEWPAGPTRDSAPDWAAPGRFRFARWDGGRMEAAKGMLSGWPCCNPPIPDWLYVMTNWYDLRTVALLRQAAINVIWVTFSNGFSLATERRQQEQLRKYIDECHRSGIHVFAYESIANMFWEDMFEHEPQSKAWVSFGKDGKPIPYSAATYAKMGRITRYMAQLTNPEWRDYLKKRIDLAIDAGADGVMYDNNFGAGLLETYQEIMRYGASRKRDFLLGGNFHADTYTFNHLVNCMTTEDGLEPGIYAAANMKGRIKRIQDTLVPVEGGFLVNNIGLFRIHQALSEGWKPVGIEPSQYEVGDRAETVMSGPRHQLALAEAMAFGIAFEVSGSSFAPGLWNDDAEKMDDWHAIGQYNRFFADNERYYTGGQSLASLAIVLDNRSATVPLLNALAARNVIYDVLYENDLSAERLKRYAAVAVLAAEIMRNSALAALESYVAGGGKLFVAGNSATRDEKGEARPRPAFFGRKTGKGECIYYQELPPVAELASALLSADRPPVVRVEAPPGVLFNAVEQPEPRRLIVHLLNYTLKPTAEIKVTVLGQLLNIRLLSPDSPRDAPQVIRSTSASMEVRVPSVKTYSLLVFERTAPEPAGSSIGKEKAPR